MPRDAVSKRIKEALSEPGRGAGDITSNISRVTREVTAYALRSTRSKKTEASRQIAVKAIESAINAGTEADANLASLIKEAITGTLQGISDAAKVDASMISHVARVAIVCTGKKGGDIVAVARKVVAGVMEVAEKVGLGVEEATSAAITGVIEAAGEIDKATADAVAKGLSATSTSATMAFSLPSKKPVILTIDSNRANLELLSQQLSKEGYEAVSAASLEELDSSLQDKKDISLALIDLSGFDQRIWERCGELQKAKTPFIIISPQRSPTIQRDSMKHGASGLLVKPVGIKELMEYIHTLLGE